MLVPGPRISFSISLAFPLLLALLIVPDARGQERHPISLHAMTGQALLAHGDHTGSYQGGMILRQFHPLGFLGVSAGLVNSSNLNLHPDRADEWRHRQFYLLEGLVHFDVVTIRFSESFANRFSFRMGLSYQYGNEETSIDVTGPGLESKLPDSMPDFLQEDSATYAYEIGGQRYDVRTIERSSTAFGTLMSLEYSIEAGPLLLALEGAYRHFPSGTPMLSYGLSVGLRY